MSTSNCRRLHWGTGKAMGHGKGRGLGTMGLPLIQNMKPLPSVDGPLIAGLHLPFWGDAYKFQLVQPVSMVPHRSLFP